MMRYPTSGLSLDEMFQVVLGALAHAAQTLLADSLVKIRRVIDPATLFDEVLKTT